MSSQNADSLQPNVYRDGRWLVVPLQGAIFPKRCVKTNQPVDDASFAFEADLLRSQLQVPKSPGEQAADVAAGALGGRAGRAAVELINKRRLKFNIGLVLFGIASMSVLRVIRSDGTYVWLEGAHPEFLASLPQSPVKWTPPLANLFGGNKQ